MVVSTSDWIQIGVLVVYTITLIVGGIIGLLQLSHAIVDINERQRQVTADINERQTRIDIVAEEWRQMSHNFEKRVQNEVWRNKFIMIGLILINCVVWFMIRQDVRDTIQDKLEQ